MPYTIMDQERIKDKASLALTVNYFSSFFTILFFLICINFLDIQQIVPWIFLGFGVLNLLNNLLYKYHKNVDLTYIITIILAFTGAIGVTLYSGGINSPFIFVLALIVFSGYVNTRLYGQIYLYLNVIIILSIYVVGLYKKDLFPNMVPEASRGMFSLLSILFSVYILGGVMGKHLIKAHHRLYKNQREIMVRMNEKETLLKEIHHRVKNNLQTISSLLSLQSKSIEDKKMKSLIKSSQHRVVSMAMIHEMLYMRDDISKIDYKSYIIELCEYLIRSNKGQDSNVKLHLDISDIRLNINTAIPLGLLINEIVTNALKYGIKDNDKGEISIELKKNEDQSYSLKIGDNGAGYPDSVNHLNSKSLGLKLINNLTRQLRGSVIRDFSKKGTHYVVHFKEIEHS